MREIALSYFLTTLNKLPYLREVLPRLISAKKDDEEIVVVDGGSSDGTREYLAELLRTKKIDHYISEPDKGEAHGNNKAIFLTRGTLLKLITDDDAFCHPDIQKCKQFMIEHPEYDILATNGMLVSQDRPSRFRLADYSNDFALWQQDGRPFGFCGLGIMMRRDSLPLLGLFHPGFARMDAEYTLRATSGAARLAWYTGSTWVRILGPKSNSQTLAKRIARETSFLARTYPNSRIAQEASVNNRMRIIYTKLLKKASKSLGIYAKTNTKDGPSVADLFILADSELAKKSGATNGKFLGV